MTLLPNIYISNNLSSWGFYRSKYLSETLHTIPLVLPYSLMNPFKSSFLINFHVFLSVLNSLPFSLHIVPSHVTLLISNSILISLSYCYCICETHLIVFVCYPKSGYIIYGCCGSCDVVILIGSCLFSSDPIDGGSMWVWSILLGQYKGHDILNVLFVILSLFFAIHIIWAIVSIYIANFYVNIYWIY